MIRAPLTLGAALLAASLVLGAQPLVRTAQPAELARGTSDGIVVTSRGTLFAGPGTEELGSPFPPPAPAQIWSVARDTSGNVYLGTGPEGRVYKIDRRGQTSLFFETAETMVTALAVTSRGELLAAAAPGGVIYRVAPDGQGEIWCETDELYVWAIEPVAGDRAYAGTGQRGRILEIAADGRFDLVFDSDEPHIVSLAALAGGALLAGGAGRGLVYRIDSEGHAMVLHDDDLNEVVALAPAGETVVAALLAPPEPEARRPVLRIQLPDRAQVGATSEATADTLQEEAGPTLHGTIEGIRPTEAPDPRRVRGRVIRINAAGESEEIWSSRHEAPHSLLAGRNGEVYFGTGEPGRLYHADRDGLVTRLTTLGEAQVTGLIGGSEEVVLATSNPARVHRLTDASATPGEFLSDPLDAGGPARWGSIRWKPAQAAATEFFTRSGNSSRPDETWSAWGPAMRDGSGSRIVNPDGRFLQWKVVQTARVERGVEISDVSVSFEPYNRRPRLEGFRIHAPGEWAAGPVELRWRASDPDGDPVQVTLEYATEKGGAWALAGVVTTVDGDGSLTWATDQIDEGVYRVRATATDQPANPYGEGRPARESPELRLVLDRTPPNLDWRSSGEGSAEVVVEDRLSMLRPLELIQDGVVRFTARPEDGVCDSRREVFRVVLPDGANGGWSVRGADAAGNSLERPATADGGAD